MKAFLAPLSFHEISISDICRNNVDFFILINAIACLLQNLVVDVGCGHRILEPGVKSFVLCQHHGHGIRLFAAGAPGTPYPQCPIALLAHLRSQMRKQGSGHKIKMEFFSKKVRFIGAYRINEVTPFVLPSFRTDYILYVFFVGSQVETLHPFVEPGGEHGFFCRRHFDAPGIVDNLAYLLEIFVRKILGPDRWLTVFLG